MKMCKEKGFYLNDNIIAYTVAQNIILRIHEQVDSVLKIKYLSSLEMLFRATVKHYAHYSKGI